MKEIILSKNACCLCLSLVFRPKSFRFVIFHVHKDFSRQFILSGKSSDLSTPTSLSASVTTTTTSSLAVTSSVSTTYSTLQSQSTINNHTSPRPSILRKRPSDRYLFYLMCVIFVLKIILNKQFILYLCNSYLNYFLNVNSTNQIESFKF